MKLIDADRLKAEIMGWCVVTDDLFGMGKYHEREIVLQAIEESPAIAAAPVVRGEWIPTDMGGGQTDEAYVCSACDEPWMLNDGTPAENNMHYCPNCGAKMESEGGT